MILKTPWGYIDLLHTWEGWMLIGAVVSLAALLYWMEWGKVKCPCNCHKPEWAASYKGTECHMCHDSGRVRRRCVSRFLRMVSGAVRGK